MVRFYILLTEISILFFVRLCVSKTV